MTMRAQHQRGATLIEAAITFILFFMFLMAVMEFGRGYYTYQAMTNAAREGARLAVSPCSLVDTAGCPPPTTEGSLPDTSWVREQIRTHLNSIAIRGTQIEIEPVAHPVNGINTQFTRVTVTYPGFRLLTIPSVTVNLQAKAEMRDETN